MELENVVNAALWDTTSGPAATQFCPRSSGSLAVTREKKGSVAREYG